MTSQFAPGVRCVSVGGYNTGFISGCCGLNGLSIGGWHDVFINVNRSQKATPMIPNISLRKALIAGALLAGITVPTAATASAAVNSPAAIVTTTKTTGKVVVQAGAFKTEARAKTYLDMLNKKGITGFSIQAGKNGNTTWYRLRTAQITPTEATAVKTKLRKAGLKYFTIGNSTTTTKKTTTKKTTTKSVATPKTTTTGGVVQAGAFRSATYAKNHAANLNSKGIQVSVTTVTRSNGTWHVVHTGKLDAAGVNKVRADLAKIGIKSFKRSGVPASTSAKKTTSTTKTSTSTTKYTVQAGSFKTEAQAKTHIAALAKKGITGFSVQKATVKGKTWYRVVSASMSSADAKAVQAKLAKVNIKSFRRAA